MESLLDDGDQNIGGDGDPDLRLNAILGSPVEGFDPQMLLDPFEKELDLPAAAVQFGDRKRGQGEIVGQEDEGLGGFGILKTDAAQRGLEALVRVEAREDDTLVADQAGLAIDRMRVPPLNLKIRFTASHEEAARLVEAIKAFKVQEATIHDVESAGLGQQLVEDVDLMHLAITDVEESRNVAAQIQQRVQLDGRFGQAERGPRKYRQTEIDGGRVERIDRLPQFDAERFPHIQTPGDSDQALGEIGVDTPVAHGVGIGQRIASHGRTNSEVIELGTLCAQAYFDVPKALPVRQLREGHAQELVQAGKRMHFKLTVIACDATAKSGQRKMLHELCEHQIALVHRSTPRHAAWQGRKTKIRNSNRDQENRSLMRFSSTTYGSGMPKRWDTTVLPYSLRN